MRGQAIVYETLERLGIPIEGRDHNAVYTVEELIEVEFPADVEGAKNLFLRDSKGKRHFLVVLPKLKKVDIAQIQRAIGCTRLSFASPDRMLRHIGVTPGAVSPLGILNDEARAVEVVLDKELRTFPRTGFHPNDNTATIFLSCDDLLRVIEDHGNKVLWI